MNAKVLIAVIAATLFPLAAYAHDCSGGADGGMDATGNQCTDEHAAAFASSDRAGATPTLLDDVSSEQKRQEADLIQLAEHLRVSAEATRRSAEQILHQLRRTSANRQQH